MEAFLRDVLTACKENFGENSRKFSPLDHFVYLAFYRPSWMYFNPNESLQTLFLRLPRLFRDGKVVWGHIIQANGLLFSPGPLNCPAEIVYSLEDPSCITYESLSSVAASLYALKNTVPDDPELASIAHYLSEETIRVFGKTVPRELSLGFSCRISTTFIIRKLLPEPKRFLTFQMLPMVVHPAEPYIALPLPTKFWPQELVDLWISID